MWMNPLTWIVLLVAGVLLVVGALFLNGGRSATQTANEQRCPAAGCGAANLTGARYCARCGRSLTRP